MDFSSGPPAFFSVVLSVILGQIPLLRELFFVNGRLAGFFMYINAFTAFLLAGVIVLVGKKELGKRNDLELFILLAGIVLSGCRTSIRRFWRDCLKKIIPKNSCTISKK